MKLHLDDIPPEGLEVSFGLEGLGAAELGPQVARVVQVLRAELRLERRGRRVTARGGYRGAVKLVCSRCLAELDYQAAGEMDLVFLPQEMEPPSTEEVQLSREQMAVVFYQGDELDLGLALRDEFCLGIPMAPLCRQDCRGLCPRCGKSLNHGDCGCRSKEIDPRWAALARLKEPKAG